MDASILDSAEKTLYVGSEKTKTIKAFHIDQKEFSSVY